MSLWTMLYVRASEKWRSLKGRFGAAKDILSMLYRQDLLRLVRRLFLHYLNRVWFGDIVSACRTGSFVHHGYMVMVRDAFRLLGGGGGGGGWARCS